MKLDLLRDEILLTPGPTAVPERILQAMMLPKMHHRTGVFKEIFAEARSSLAQLLHVNEPPIFLASTGTGAMEAALSSLFTPEKEVLVLNAGQFGRRWYEIANRLGYRMHEITVPWGTTFDLDEVIKVLKLNSGIKIVCFQDCETSTATLHPTPKLAKAIKSVREEIIVVVDVVSSVGTRDINMEEEEIDVLVGASQKALMLPPGLAFVSMNEKAWEIAMSASPRSYYFDLVRERKVQQRGETAWTPATTLIAGLREALIMINEERPEKCFERHLIFSKSLRAAVSAMELKVFPNANHSPGVTAIEMPESIDAESVRASLREKYKVRLAGGQGTFKGKLLRIGHMGNVKKTDLVIAIWALDEVLTEMGVIKGNGAGLSAFNQAYKRTS